MTQREVISDVGFDAIAVKPSHTNLSRVTSSPIDTVVIDFDGREHFPSNTTILELQETTDTRVTIPIRVDGFDPLGDREYLDSLPTETKVVLVAGNPAYLTEEELHRSIAPRLGTAVDEFSNAWIGTEGIPLIALATTAPLFFLLSPESKHTIQKIRSAGYPGSIAIYAPTVVTTDTDTILQTLGPYTMRREPVRRQLEAESLSSLDSDKQELLLRETQKYALTGSVSEINTQISRLKTKGADNIVSYLPTGW